MKSIPVYRANALACGESGYLWPKLKQTTDAIVKAASALWPSFLQKGSLSNLAD